MSFSNHRIFISRSSSHQNPPPHTYKLPPKPQTFSSHQKFSPCTSSFLPTPTASPTSQPPHSPFSASQPLSGCKKYDILDTSVIWRHCLHTSLMLPRQLDVVLRRRVKRGSALLQRGKKLSRAQIAVAEYRTNIRGIRGGNLNELTNKS